MCSIPLVRHVSIQSYAKKEEAKQLKYRLRLHREEIERWDPTTPGTLRTRIVSSTQKFFLRNDGETWNKWIVHMDAAKIHDIKDNRRSSLGRNNDRDGNWISASEESQERLQDQRASRKDNARLGKGEEGCTNFGIRCRITSDRVLSWTRGMWIRVRGRLYLRWGIDVHCMDGGWDEQREDDSHEEYRWRRQIGYSLESIGDVEVWDQSGFETNLGRENEFRWCKHNVSSKHSGESARETWQRDSHVQEGNNGSKLHF